MSFLRHVGAVARKDLRVELRSREVVYTMLFFGAMVVLIFSFAFVEGESLMMGFSEVAVSSGSACTSASLEPSYVLKSLGVGDDLAHSSIRFSLGRFNTQEEIDHVAQRVVEAVNHLRAMSPLYEMAQEGIDLSTVEWAAH